MSIIDSCGDRFRAFLLSGTLLLTGCSAGNNSDDRSDTQGRDAVPVAAPERDSSATFGLLSDPNAKVVRDAEGNVVQLDLRACGFGDAEMQSLPTLKSTLKVLKLSGKDGRCEVTDAALQSIGELSNLKVLALDLLPISNAGLQELVKLKSLQELYLAKTNIDDGATETLSHFPELKKLRLAGTAITTVSADRIARLEQLVDLDLSECAGIGDDAAASLSRLPRIEKLNLYLTGVGDRAAASLSSCQTLRWLNLDATGLTDAGLAEIGELSGLTFLHLGSTSISDEGLPSLAKLDQLEKLIVTRTRVTQAGVDSLQPSLPQTEIQWIYVAPPQ